MRVVVETSSEPLNKILHIAVQTRSNLDRGGPLNNLVEEPERSPKLVELVAAY